MMSNAACLTSSGHKVSCQKQCTRPRAAYLWTLTDKRVCKSPILINHFLVKNYATMKIYYETHSYDTKKLTKQKYFCDTIV